MTVKRFQLISILLCMQIYSYAQQFSFTFYFQDSAGNRDSIILGYDSNATDSIDASFNEINILNQHINIGLDVRISNLYQCQHYPFQNFSPFQTKKNILNGTCSTNPSTIDIITNNWPVIAYWKRELFLDSCNYGTLFTSVSEGGWFDTGTQSDLWIALMKDKDSVVFTSNYLPGSSANEFYTYTNDSNVIVPVFWFVFSRNDMVSSNNNTVEDENGFTVCPNPAESELTVILKNQVQYTDHKLLLCNQLGQVLTEFEMKKGENEKSINCVGWCKGIYYLMIRDKLGNCLAREKIIKN